MAVFRKLDFLPCWRKSGGNPLKIVQFLTIDPRQLAARDTAQTATDHFDPLIYSRLGYAQQCRNFLAGAIVGDKRQHFALLFRQLRQ